MIGFQYDFSAGLYHLLQSREARLVLLWVVKPPRISPKNLAIILLFFKGYSLRLIQIAFIGLILSLSLGWADPAQSSQVCREDKGRFETGSFRSSLLKLPMEYRVYLPPCYDQESERRYPVLYLLHGQNYNDDQWERLGVGEQADRLIAAGEIPPFLIVMPRDRNWDQPSQDPFGKVLVDEFIPFIDQHYRTLAERPHRAIGGLSRGAGWAVHLGLARWDLFGVIGGHSLPVFWEDTGKIRSWLGNIPRAELPRIYLDIGDRDRPQILESAVWFEELLTRQGIPHEWYLFSGYHEEAYWQKNLPRYLQWYAKDW